MYMDTNGIEYNAYTVQDVHEDAFALFGRERATRFDRLRVDISTNDPSPRCCKCMQMTSMAYHVQHVEPPWSHYNKQITYAAMPQDMCSGMATAQQPHDMCNEVTMHVHGCGNTC